MTIDSEIIFGIMGAVGGALGMAFAEHKSNDNKTAKALDRLSDKVDPFITDTARSITRIEEAGKANRESIVNMDSRLSCVERVTGVKPPLNSIKG